jgi:hypothetical protein
MKFDFIDVQGLAGAWSLGSVQAGFRMKHRVSLPGGFGDEVTDANRHLLGGDWEQQVGTADEWTPIETSFICGTPPCS